MNDQKIIQNQYCNNENTETARMQENLIKHEGIGGLSNDQKHLLVISAVYKYISPLPKFGFLPQKLTMTSLPDDSWRVQHKSTI